MMSEVNVTLLEQALLSIRVPSQELLSLHRDRYFILKRHNFNTLLLPTQDGRSVFAITRLIGLDPMKDSSLLALALSLNFSPKHTLAASIALDVEHQMLCLRSSHDLSTRAGHQFGLILDQHLELAKNIKEIFQQFLENKALKARSSSQ
jgi:Tir chaperone protein (CesT) family